MAAGSTPLVGDGVGARVLVDPEVALGSFAGAGGKVADGGFVDLEVIGCEAFPADGFRHGGEALGDGRGPAVQGVAPEVDVLTGGEYFRLAVVREVVAVLGDCEVGGEAGRTVGAGYGHGRHGCL